MFTDIPFQSVYYSKENNIAAEFYVPILENAISFDRVSAYFSAKILAYCAEGMEYFIHNSGKCRLILSKELSEEDYNSIKKGYKLKSEIEEGLIKDLSDELSLSEQEKLSNLAYLIAKGIVEIKIAFMPIGTFHYKFGIYRDKNQNIVTSCGSDNFTKAAVIDNAEALSITCSWLCSEFDYEKISSNMNKFIKLWNNKDAEALVLFPTDNILKKIISFDKTKNDDIKKYQCNNAIFIDLIGDNLLVCNRDIEHSNKLQVLKKIYFRRYIKSESTNLFICHESLSYLDYKKIIQILKSKLPDAKLIISPNLSEFIETKELYLNERSQLGIDIKKRNPFLQPKLEEYKQILLNTMTRQLRNQQLWDSFFMYTMKKSSNFSVPGSGKTSSVLGMFSYLYSKEKIDRIIVISPINAFGSWIDEFKLCFGNKIKLNCFNSHEVESSEEQYKILTYDYGKYNLFLFNYENVHKFKKQIFWLLKEKGLLVFDEVHKVKGIEGARAKTCLDIAQNANYVVTMTGTPIPNSYCDIYNNLHILFPDEYDSWFNFSPSFLKYAKAEDIITINNKIYPFFCRTSKHQLGVPPAKKDLIINVVSSKVENELFNIVYSKYKNNKFALIIRLLQLESSPALLLDKIDIEEFKQILDIRDDIQDLDYKDYSQNVVELIKSIKVSSKVIKALELITKLVQEKKQVIVWTLFTKNIDALKMSLNEIGITCDIIRGDIPAQERIQIINKFKNQEFNVLLTNPHTLAESVSLHSVCHDAIYFEYSYNLVHLLQSKDRIHRLGLPDNQYTQYYFLQNVFDLNGYRFSLDEQIYNRLLFKEKVMLDAVDDNKLEQTYSDEEDINAIFKKLKL